jgi:hypothetical protein
MMRYLVLGLFFHALPAHCRGQDSTRLGIPDSITLDTVSRGPHYEFTGREDPALLASIFRHTYQLGKRDAGDLAHPAVLCLAVGRDSVIDASQAILDLLAKHTPPVRPRSACKVNEVTRPNPNEIGVTETATGKRAWNLSISALHYLNDSSVVAYSSFYVGPLFAAGWTCTVGRAGAQWVVKSCTMRWIS